MHCFGKTTKYPLEQKYNQLPSDLLKIGAWIFHVWFLLRLVPSRSDGDIADTDHVLDATNITATVMQEIMTEL